MSENHSKPSLNDYRSMMHTTHAPSRLQDDVLKQATRVREGHESPAPCDEVAQACPRTHTEPTLRSSTRSAKQHPATAPKTAFHAARRRAFRPAIAIAACLVLTVSLFAAGSAIGWPGGTPPEGGGSASAGGNSFVLAAYAAENPEGTPGKTVLLDSSQFYGGGGNSGSWYNPADQTFWDYPWVGYKYNFSLNCTGSNIESLTYEIEGERSYFEMLDSKVAVTPPEKREEGSRAFNYTKTATFDYDNQQSITDERSISLYIGYPLSDSGMQALNTLYAEGNSDPVNKQLDIAHEVGAAQEMSTSRLRLTATFADGSTQAKTFVIEPIANLVEVYSAYWDASNAWEDEYHLIQNTPGQEIPVHPQKPKLYTITEVIEA